MAMDEQVEGEQATKNTTTPTGGTTATAAGPSGVIKRSVSFTTSPPEVHEIHRHEEMDEDSSPGPSSSISSPERKLPLKPSPFILLLKTSLNCIVILLGVLLTSIFLFGAYDYLRNIEAEKCSMTYMFEFPHYVKLQIDPETDQKYPMYGLYAYAEGKNIHSAREKNFKGIPILFLPGNAGSEKQVRSFGSVALWKSLESQTPFHFDFFSIDFHEEMSGLYGYVLERQVEYTRLAIEKITSFYEDYHQVVLMGHSMGGMIARAVNKEKEPLISLFYTFATPHLHPVIVTDPEIDLFYYHVSKKWDEMKALEAKDKDQKQVTLLSIAGGERDFLVQEKFTTCPHNDIHVSATKVPDCWASTHHLSIVWCKQIVMATIRSLFDLVQYQKRNNYYAITDDPELRKRVLSYHFVKRPSGKSYLTAFPPEQNKMIPPAEAKWEEVLVNKFCTQPSSSKQATYVMFPMVVIKEKVRLDSPNDYKVLISTSSTGHKSWIFGCKSQTIKDKIRYCSESDNLSHLGEIVPSFHRRRKIIHLDYKSVDKYSHLIVKMHSSSAPLCVNMEVYNDKERQIPADTFEFKSYNSIFYNLTIPFGSTLRSHIAWRISLHLKSQDKNCERLHYNSIGIFKQGNFQIHRFFKNETLTVRLMDWKELTGNALLYLEPSCNYVIKKEFAELETAGQLFRNYVRILPAYLAGIFLMSLYFQDQGDGWKNPLRILISNAYYLTILPGFAINFLLWFLPNDYPVFLDGAKFTPFLPIICFLVAYVIAIILVSLSWAIIYFSGKTLYGIITKILKRKIGGIPEKLTDFAFDITFSKLPVSIAALLVSIAIATCGELALCAGLVLHLIKIFKRYESLLEDLLRGRTKDIDESLSHVNFQLSLATIWFMVTALNIPSLIHWIKNFGYGTTPQWDLSFYISLILVPTISVLWQGFVPLFNQRLWNLHRYVFYVMGLAVIVWGTHRLYIISFICSLCIVTLGIIQLASTMMRLAQHQEQLLRQELELQRLEEEATAKNIARAKKSSEAIKALKESEMQSESDPEELGGSTEASSEDEEKQALLRDLEQTFEKNT